MHVGLLGCGKISGIYLKNLMGQRGAVRVTACADAAPQAAKATAAEWGIRAMAPDELLEAADIDCIFLLPPPAAHFELGMQVLESGKHLYVEKPLALTVSQGKMLLKRARDKRLRVGCAPDTFLGAGLQTVFSAISRGDIGKPIAAAAFMLCAGHELWHPSPEVYYKTGGGPIFDMAPYALTALLKVFGPPKEVCAMGARSFSSRAVATGPRQGERFPVEVDTIISGQVRFACGALVNLFYSFDTAPTSLPHLEIYGEKGTILAPDPNFFNGPVKLGLQNGEGWRTLALQGEAPAYNARGIGLVDMAEAVRENRPHQADAETGLQVLAVMEALLQAATHQNVVHIDCNL